MVCNKGSVVFMPQGMSLSARKGSLRLQIILRLPVFYKENHVDRNTL